MPTSSLVDLEAGRKSVYRRRRRASSRPPRPSRPSRTEEENPEETRSSSRSKGKRRLRKDLVERDRLEEEDPSETAGRRRRSAGENLEKPYDYEKFSRVFRDLEEDREKLRTENRRASEDVSLLKNLVYRLNAQLERQQERFGNDSRADFKTRSRLDVLDERDLENEERKISRAWASVDLHALGPLLNAYQENLQEKRDLVKAYEKEMADFGARCKIILAENERMHREVEDLGSKCKRYEEEISTTLEAATVLKKRHDLLLQELNDRKRRSADFRSTYERRIESILEQNEVLKKDLAMVSSDLSNIRGKYEVLKTEFDKAKSKEEKTVPLVVHKSAVDEFRRSFEELKYRYEADRRELCDQVKRMEENQPDNEKQLAVVTAERNQLRDFAKRLEKGFERAQRKNERIRSIVGATRLSCDSLKERLSKATTCREEIFAEYERIVTEREKLLDLLRETQKENASIDRLGRNISDRVDGLKIQLDIVRRGAKQQVAIVEKRIELQESRVRRIKRDYQRKVRRFKAIIKERENVIGKLSKENENQRTKGTSFGGK